MSRPQWLAGLALLFLAACEIEYAGLDFDVQSSPPVPVSIESDRIEIPAGIAIQVAVRPLSEGEPYSASDHVLLRSDDPEVLAVYATTNGRQFVLVGLRKGKTCLQVKINRHEKECIDVRVLAPEE